jgi:stage II sporulation protein E
MLVGAELSDTVLEVGKDGGVMTFSTRPKVRAACSHGRLSRTGREWSSADVEGREHIYIDLFDENDEEVCGDMTDAFITDGSYFYALISDGMGSGSSAAYTSGVCSMFIEKMLSAGNRADITLRMLNNVIRSENMGCGDECSATVDLLELDLMSGGASFIKSGAAPTYIAREGTVYKVSSRTMPVGIIKDADARITKFDTKKGDIIVMMSDGCCHDSEDCQWLVEYLCDYMTGAKKTVPLGEELCERLKNEILREAQKNAPEGEERDDISVSVTVVI